MNAALAQDPVVYIVDDDADLRGALDGLFRSVGLVTSTFANAREYLAAKRAEVVSCLVVDVRMPGLSGLDFHEQLARAGDPVPVIFMTGHGDIPMTVRAMKAGAVDFLTKPFRDQDMLDAVTRALAQDTEQRAGVAATALLRQRWESLTPRQSEVFTLVTSGLMNKQIAGLLEVSEITVKIHRGEMTRKMEARSVADLVRMAEALGIRRIRP